MALPWLLCVSFPSEVSDYDFNDYITGRGSVFQCFVLE